MASKSADSFIKDLKGFQKTIEKTATDIFRKVSLDLDSAVVLSTPIDTGRARGNWYPSIGTPSDKKENTRTQNDSLSEIQTVALGANIGQIVWLTNNLPYILKLENGSSKQAPIGMVGTNVQRFASIFGGEIIR